MAFYRLETIGTGTQEDIPVKIICEAPEEHASRLICEFNGTASMAEALAMVDALNRQPITATEIMMADNYRHDRQFLALVYDVLAEIDEPDSADRELRRQRLREAKGARERFDFWFKDFELPDQGAR